MIFSEARAVPQLSWWLITQWLEGGGVPKVH